MSETDLRLPLLAGDGQRVTSLVNDWLKIDIEDSVTTLRSLFLQHGTVAAIPVTKLERPVGWVSLHDVMPDLPAGTTVASVIRHGCQTIEQHIAVDELLCGIREGGIDISEAGLIVVDESGRYLGRIGLVTLLRTIAGAGEPVGHKEAHLRNLTGGMPGKLELLAQTRQLLRNNALFVVASLDVKGFNAFNDRYGYARGDEVIRFVSELLHRYLDPEQDFAAYLGGDNFTMLLRSIDWFERCEEILQACEMQAPGFYDAKDRRRGGVEQYNHLGERLFTPTFSLSIGVTQVEPGKFRDHHSLLKAARELKVRAASSGGNAIFVEGLSGSAIGGVFGIVHH